MLNKIVKEYIEQVRSGNVEELIVKVNGKIKELDARIEVKINVNKCEDVVELFIIRCILETALRYNVKGMDEFSKKVMWIADNYNWIYREALEKCGKNDVKDIIREIKSNVEETTKLHETKKLILILNPQEVINSLYDPNIIDFKYPTQIIDVIADSRSSQIFNENYDLNMLISNTRNKHPIDIIMGTLTKEVKDWSDEKRLISLKRLLKIINMHGMKVNEENLKFLRETIMVIAESFDVKELIGKKLNEEELKELIIIFSHNPGIIREFIPISHEYMNLVELLIRKTVQTRDESIEICPRFSAGIEKVREELVRLRDEIVSKMYREKSGKAIMIFLFSTMIYILTLLIPVFKEYSKTIALIYTFILPIAIELSSLKILWLRYDIWGSKILFFSYVPQVLGNVQISTMQPTLSKIQYKLIPQILALLFIYILLERILKKITEKIENPDEKQMKRTIYNVFRKSISVIIGSTMTITLNYTFPTT